jgi:hypothetical protein
MSPTTIVASGVTVTAGFVPGNALSRFAAIADICACAASSDASRRSRANRRRLCDCRLDARSPNASGVHIWTPGAQNIGKSNARGITPTTVYDLPLTISDVPRTSGFPANRRCQYLQESMMGRSPVVASSSARNERPIRGRTPVIASTSDVTLRPCTRSGTSPVTVPDQYSAAPNEEKSELCRFQSR